MIFYHSTTPEQWAKYETEDHYAAESLYTEGFIHASFAEQLEPTLKIHFKGIEKVWILTIDSDLLTSKLVVEASRNGELFPHIYGTLNKSAIVDRVVRVL
jgi:uncharacterized protein (DUF952 family)